MKYFLASLVAVILPSVSLAQFDLGGSAEDAVRTAIENAARKQEKQDSVAKEIPAQSTEATAASSEPATLHMFGKYDFIAGEKILLADDFSNTTVGDFPKSWKTNGSGDIVTTSLSSGHWLMIKPNAVYLPSWHGALPENMTLEFDMINADLGGAEGSWTLSLFESVKGEQMDAGMPGSSGLFFNIWPFQVQVYNWKDKQDAGISNQVPCNVFGDFNKTMHVAVWRQGTRVRLWMNEIKVYDLPQFVPDGATLNAFQISSNVPDGVHVIFTNVRLAEGAPDTRNSLMTDGRLSTTGITFDVGSDVIRPSSFGVLRSIADVLKENAGVRVRIVGHTDNDGKADANLQLSIRRAAAVMNAFTHEFGIAAGRMEADGKGASEPITPNTTPEGKAGNRRVEFVKL